jgi:hypothetical protein
LLTRRNGKEHTPPSIDDYDDLIEQTQEQEQASPAAGPYSVVLLLIEQSINDIDRTVNTE